jgi:predicted site-specific integrase-resolvase
MAARLVSGPPRRFSGEFIPLRKAPAEYGIPYSTLRSYISDGRLPAFKLPNRKVFIRPADVAALFIPVEPKEISA